MQQGMRAMSVPPEYQSMSAARKEREAALAKGSYTPSTPTKTRITSWTPIPIPGTSTPRKVIPSRQWTLKDPFHNPARPRSTAVAKSCISTSQAPGSGSNAPQKAISRQPEPSKNPFNNPTWLSTTGSPATPQPLKGMLKTPDRGQYSDGNSTQPGVQGKSYKKRKKHKTPGVSWGGDIKHSHGSS
ncbi:hypothetical protein VTG60DRAFT_3324 [Thermothelomyces hinnuleus]